jgi:hypothetical protein
MAKGCRKGAEMNGNIASAKSEPATPTAAPTGYRVSLVPGALEISARLGTAEELRNLMKVLRAGIVIFEEAGEDDLDEPLTLTKRLDAVSARSSQGKPNGSARIKSAA